MRGLAAAVLAALTGRHAAWATTPSNAAEFGVRFTTTGGD